MDFKSNIPIYLQATLDIKKRIISGSILPGSKLPSARELALEYGINPNTANKVYNELLNSGICYVKRGIGTYVTEDEGVFYIIKKEMAEILLDEFVSGMKGMGFEKNIILDMLQKTLDK
jgi:DNA-binding transcriptional regulator YhcF (GntR family)